MLAGKDLTIVAQDAGKDSDITVTRLNLSASTNMALEAEGDIVLQAARNAFVQKTDSKRSSASIDYTRIYGRRRPSRDNLRYSARRRRGRLPQAQ